MSEFIILTSTFSNIVISNSPLKYESISLLVNTITPLGKTKLLPLEAFNKVIELLLIPTKSVFTSPPHSIHLAY